MVNGQRQDLVESSPSSRVFSGYELTTRAPRWMEAMLYHAVPCCTICKRPSERTCFLMRDIFNHFFNTRLDHAKMNTYSPGDTGDFQLGDASLSRASISAVVLGTHRDWTGITSGIDASENIIITFLMSCFWFQHVSTVRSHGSEEKCFRISTGQRVLREDLVV